MSFYICVDQYEEYGENFVDMLDGVFSFVLLDTRDNSFLAARDAIGITPLYIGWGLDGKIQYVARSHQKCRYKCIIFGGSEQK